jgi:hypothetical protein
MKTFTYRCNECGEEHEMQEVRDDYICHLCSTAAGYTVPLERDYFMDWSSYVWWLVMLAFFGAGILGLRLVAKALWP